MNVHGNVSTPEIAHNIGASDLNGDVVDAEGARVREALHAVVGDRRVLVKAKRNKRAMCDRESVRYMRGHR